MVAGNLRANIQSLLVRKHNLGTTDVFEELINPKDLSIKEPLCLSLLPKIEEITGAITLQYSSLAPSIMAVYNPDNHIIHTLYYSQYVKPEFYYHFLLHETCHALRHSPEGNSSEEFIAEATAFLLLSEVFPETNPNFTIRYLTEHISFIRKNERNHWIEVRINSTIDHYHVLLPIVSEIPNDFN